MTKAHMEHGRVHTDAFHEYFMIFPHYQRAKLNLPAAESCEWNNDKLCRNSSGLKVLRRVNSDGTKGIATISQTLPATP